jgi:hypothetical protein
MTANNNTSNNKPSPPPRINISQNQSGSGGMQTNGPGALSHPNTSSNPGGHHNSNNTNNHTNTLLHSTTTNNSQKSSPTPTPNIHSQSTAVHQYQTSTHNPQHSTMSYNHAVNSTNGPISAPKNISPMHSNSRGIVPLHKLNAPNNNSNNSPIQHVDMRTYQQTPHEVKETKDVKRNRAQLPAALSHAQPTTGDWLKKRYIVNNYILLDTLGSGSYGEVINYFILVYCMYLYKITYIILSMPRCDFVKSERQINYML